MHVLKNMNFKIFTKTPLDSAVLTLRLTFHVFFNFSIKKPSFANKRKGVHLFSLTLNT